jgi:CheY-like chemotaxis protein
MDLGMPGVSGYEAARRIRQQDWGRGLALVAVTGWGQDEDRRRSSDAGFDVHLVKPVDLRSLQDVFSRFGRPQD